DLYRRIGFESLGRQIQAGAVTFELMSATVKSLRERLKAHSHVAQRLEGCVDWQLDVPMLPGSCEHGGAFWKVLGEEFQALDRRSEIINADVLDAWFPPAPGILAAIGRHLPWLLSTSPPVGCEGMVRAIARARGVDPRCILPGDGSSSLIYQVFRHWLEPSSRVLILDPTYGEYAHILERVIRCRVERLPLPRAGGYQLDVAPLEEGLTRGYDLVVLVNPNSPTGRHVPRTLLERALDRAPAGTRVWIDETYVEYAGPRESLESYAAGRENIAVCKSLSKVYALSGVRAAYLCAAPNVIDALRSMTPPWAVSLPAQVAAVLALEDPGYYAARHEETRVNRAWLAGALSRLPGMEVIPSDANFVLCHAGEPGPDAAALCEHCRARGLFLRNAGGISPRLGDRSVRIAVKDAETNRRMIAIISSAYE
ncbi:MAG TPA: histidinol-phosphate transaminase, partial [Planctomycetota bacterium]|nr:histidinol-phosphate transaminase [Planctomycetota bacterium]